MHKNCPLDAVIKVLEEERWLGASQLSQSRKSENEIETLKIRGSIRSTCLLKRKLSKGVGSFSFQISWICL